MSVLYDLRIRFANQDYIYPKLTRKEVEEFIKRKFPVIYPKRIFSFKRQDDLFIKTYYIIRREK